MESAMRFGSELSNRIIKDDEVFSELKDVVTEMIKGNLELTTLVGHMAQVLTNQDPEYRAKGIKFLSKLLKALPEDYLTEMQIKFISKFYCDRLKDNHRVIPHVLEGYFNIIGFKNYNLEFCKEFLLSMFNEVPCQSQVHQDRHNIYRIIHKLTEIGAETLKLMGPDLVYGVISAIEGERDPRNLLYLFKFLPQFMSKVSLGHLTENMFEVLSCYFPIDFHPNPDDPNAVSRDDLSNALAPCLSAVPEFGENCLILLMEKLDSNLRVAKIDSLKLLTISCSTFSVESYYPFAKALWSSMWREICNKTDDDLRMAAYQALSALTNKLSTSANSDQNFEKFVQAIIVSMQSSMAESSTVIQFTHSTKALLTVANASQESCKAVVLIMIPSTIAYYGLITSIKLQMCCMTFLADLVDMALHWEIQNQMESLVNEIPQLCLLAVSKPDKEQQIVAFETLKRVLKHNIKPEFVVPFIDVLMNNVQHSKDEDLVNKSIDTIHSLGVKFPELIMDMVVKDCKIHDLVGDESLLIKRLPLLCNLASIDEFTEIIFKEFMKVIKDSDTRIAYEVVKYLNIALSSELYSVTKVNEIEHSFNLCDRIISWIHGTKSYGKLTHSLAIISNIVASLLEEDQRRILCLHVSKVIDTEVQDIQYLTMAAICISLIQSIYEEYFTKLLAISLSNIFQIKEEIVINYSCKLIAHLVNKVSEVNMVTMNEIIKEHIKSEPDKIKEILKLSAYLTKGFILRGSKLFEDSLTYINECLRNSEICFNAAEAIRLIMSDSKEYLTSKYHCKTSFLYKQRMFQKFMALNEGCKINSDSKTKEAYLLSLAYILQELPKTIILGEADKISSDVIDSLDHPHTELLKIMADVLIILVTMKQVSVANSLQTLLPRLVKLTKYQSMEVRMKSLDCVFEIGNNYPTLLLLPHKQETLFGLCPALDDRKRLVRAAGVRARTRWFMIGAPGE